MVDRCSPAHFGVGGFSPNGTSVAESAGSVSQSVTTTYFGWWRLTCTHGKPPPVETSNWLKISPPPVTWFLVTM